MVLIEKDGVFVEDDPGDSTKLLAKKLASTDSPYGFHVDTTPPGSPKSFHQWLEETTFEQARYHPNLKITADTVAAPAFVSHRLQVHRFYVPYDCVANAQGLANPATVAVTVATITGLDGVTVTIGNQTYTFKTTLTAATTAGQVLIGLATTNAAENLMHAMNGTPGKAGVEYGSYTIPHRTVNSTFSASTVTVSARRPGRAGNQIVVATSDNTKVGVAGQTTLLGGGDAGLAAASTAIAGTVINYYYVDVDQPCDGTKRGYYDQYRRRLMGWQFHSPVDPGGPLTLMFRNQTTNLFTLAITTGNNQAGSGNPQWGGRMQVSSSGGGDFIPANAYLQAFIADTSGSVVPPAGSCFTTYFAREF